MKKHPCVILLVLIAVVAVRAEILPAERALPKDTLGFYTIPDVARLRAAFASSPQGQLWNDPAIKAFKDKLVNKFTEEIVAPLEKELGVKFADYEGLAQGQFTLAVVQNGWQGDTNVLPALLLILDTRDKSDQLKKTLADLKKKWTDSGRQIKAEKIRDIEFSTLLVSGDDLAKSLEKSFPGAGGPKTSTPDPKPADEKSPAPTKTGLTIGQAESLLIVGTAPGAIEKLLVRMSGGLVPALIEDPVYESNHNTLFRDAQWFGWVNARVLIELLNKQLKSAKTGVDPSMPAPEKIISGLGVNGLKSFAVSYRDNPEGAVVQFFVGVPEAGRQGLFKILAADAKPSEPPPFIPADTVKFTRWRLDGQKAWNSLETMITGIFPSAGGVLKLFSESAGKDKDPKYDLRRELIGNLGDDLITYDKSPRTPTFAELGSPPSITLIGSPNPDRFANAIKVLMGTVGLGPDSLKEREFLGRKIYSMSLPGALPAADGKPKEFSFAGSGGYLAMSSDVATLEEYLRGAENKPKPLAEIPGLADAAQKVGGMGTGLFGYANNGEEVRALLEVLKKDSSALESIFGPGTPLGAGASKDSAKTFKDWVDVSLLPPYDALAKYFSFSVFGGAFTADGFLVKAFAPVPPGLKK